MKYGFIFYSVWLCNIRMFVCTYSYLICLGLVLCFEGFNAYIQLLGNMIFLSPNS